MTTSNIKIVMGRVYHNLVLGINYLAEIRDPTTLETKAFKDAYRFKPIIISSILGKKCLIINYPDADPDINIKEEALIVVMEKYYDLYLGIYDKKYDKILRGFGTLHGNHWKIPFGTARQGPKRLSEINIDISLMNLEYHRLVKLATI